MGGCAKLHLVLLHYTAVGSLHNTRTLPHLLPRRYGRNGIPGSAPELMIVLTTYRPSDFLGTNDSHPQSSTERFQVQTSISLDHCTSPLSNNKRAACVTDPRPSIAHSNNKRQRIASPRNITTTTTTTHQAPRFPIACVDNELKTRNCNLHCDNLTTDVRVRQMERRCNNGARDGLA